MPTPAQKRWQYIDRVLTPEIFAEIHSSQHRLPAHEWAQRLGIDKRLIERIRNGDRGATRKPMGGDRRSNNFRRKDGS